MINQVQVDKLLLGWKEYELEVVRDRHDNCVIVCGIENIDAMGVHTGDSVTVAPILTLTDKEYQALRDASLAIMREVGVETGGSNVQFAVNPNPEARADGTKPFEFVVVEMNPRVSRSSALASKATGFPIAKIAAKLAIGYTLDELRNDITGTTSACFEPSIDYVVTKMPRWTFEKFPEADETLTTQMKSVGEAMAIGRTFKESLQKVDPLDGGQALRARARPQRQVARKPCAPSSTPGPRAHPRPTTRRPTRHPTTGGRTSLGARTADGAPIEWPIDLDKLVRKLAVPEPGAAVLRPLRVQDGVVDRARPRAHADRPVLPRPDRAARAFEDTLSSYDTLERCPGKSCSRQGARVRRRPAREPVPRRASAPRRILAVRRHRESLGIARCSSRSTPAPRSSRRHALLLLDLPARMDRG
jgi:hypothetical protein